MLRDGASGFAYVSAPHRGEKRPRPLDRGDLNRLLHEIGKSRAQLERCGADGTALAAAGTELRRRLYSGADDRHVVGRLLRTIRAAIAKGRGCLAGVGICAVIDTLVGPDAAPAPYSAPISAARATNTRSASGHV